MNREAKEPVEAIPFVADEQLLPIDYQQNPPLWDVDAIKASLTEETTELFEDELPLLSERDQVLCETWKRPKEVFPNAELTIVDVPTIKKSGGNKEGGKRKFNGSLQSIGKLAETLARDLTFIATHPTKVDDGCYLWENLASLETNGTGKYMVRVCVLGIWRCVAVDDRLPCSKIGECLLPFIRTTKKGRKRKEKIQLWPLILSKALLKLRQQSFYTLVGWHTLRTKSPIAGTVARLDDETFVVDLRDQNCTKLQSLWEDHSQPFLQRTVLLRGDNEVVIQVHKVPTTASSASSLDFTVSQFDWKNNVYHPIVESRGHDSVLLTLKPNIPYVVQVAECSGFLCSIYESGDSVKAVCSGDDSDVSKWWSDFAPCLVQSGYHGSCNDNEYFLPVCRFDFTTPETEPEVAFLLNVPTAMKGITALQLFHKATQSVTDFALLETSAMKLQPQSEYSLLGYGTCSSSVCSGNWQLRVLSTVPLSGSSVEMNSSRFEGQYEPNYERQLLKEDISTNTVDRICSVTMVVSEPTLRIASTITEQGERKQRKLGIGSITLKNVLLHRDMKSVLTCIIDEPERSDQSLEDITWTLIVTPAVATLKQNSDHADRVRQLAAKWEEEEPGRNERARQERESVLELAANQPVSKLETKKISSCNGRARLLDGAEAQSRQQLARDLAEQYVASQELLLQMKTAQADILREKRTQEKEIMSTMHQKGSEQSATEWNKRELYRAKLNEFDQLLQELDGVVEADDNDECGGTKQQSIVNAVEAVTSAEVPDWKVGTKIDRALDRLWTLRRLRLQSVINDHLSKPDPRPADLDAVRAALADCKDAAEHRVPSVGQPTVEAISLQAKAQAFIWEHSPSSVAFREQWEASEEDRDPEKLGQLISDGELKDWSKARFLPKKLFDQLSEAEKWIQLTQTPVEPQVEAQ